MAAPLILLVDDDPAMLATVAIELEDSGYRVAQARNGQEALGIVGTITPHLVILDLAMPILDGREFLDRMGGRTPFPVIVVTGQTIDRPPAGIAGIVFKPFDLPDLIDLVVQYAPVETTAS